MFLKSSIVFSHYCHFPGWKILWPNLLMFTLSCHSSRRCKTLGSIARLWVQNKNSFRIFCYYSYFAGRLYIRGIFSVFYRNFNFIAMQQLLELRKCGSYYICLVDAFWLWILRSFCELLMHLLPALSSNFWCLCLQRFLSWLTIAYPDFFSDSCWTTSFMGHWDDHELSSLAGVWRWIWQQVTGHWL